MATYADMVNTSKWSARRATFRKLHESACFLIPNPWDIGSAHALASLGFKALATTSSGFAWSRAHADNAMDIEAVLAHCHEIVEATDLPVNADFEDGHARGIDGLKKNVRRCIETGVAGLSIEDSTGDASQPLYGFDEAVARMRAARAAIDASGEDVMLIGRAECFLVGRPDPLNEALTRLRACTRRARARRNRSGPSSLPSRPSRSMCWSGVRCRIRWVISHNSGYAASAWAVGWRVRRGAVSCVPPADWSKAVLMVSPAMPVTPSWTHWRENNAGPERLHRRGGSRQGALAVVCSGSFCDIRRTCRALRWHNGPDVN
jgi:hypothetical protein